jgi:N-acetylgalactosamine kinase
MASRHKHKVCFPIAGTPAIVGAIDTYKKAGLKRFLVVVGQMADQVMRTVSASHPDVTYAYQAEARGTGHATVAAVKSLAAAGYRGDVVVVMGDKVTRPEVVRRLLARFADGNSEAVMTALPKEPHSTAGRVVMDGDGQVIGILELGDIQRAEEQGKGLKLSGMVLRPSQVEQRSDAVNASMYAFRFPALDKALRQIGSDNAQSEMYLTDTVEYLAQRGRVDVLLLEEPTDLMGFNTPAELLAIEEVIRKRAKGPRVSVSEKIALNQDTLKPIREWLHILNGAPVKLRSELRRLYGPDVSLAEERRQAMLRLLERAEESLGPERPVILCRGPGRINLMGRHVDHRGGYVNVMAISLEVLLVASPREDDTVSLRNLEDERFPHREFRISDLLGEASWADWMDFVGSGTVRRAIDAAPGDWSHYARAPLFRLQHECRDVRLKGMDCVVSGNIPIGAGLSSSSALVVSFAKAAVALNGLRVTMRDFVDLCGEGEWFVGSAGGSADHAAISTGKAGYVSRIGFFPFRTEGEVPLPSDLDVVIANSGAQAVKSAGARDVYNQRVACYELAEMLLRHTWPAAMGMQHLRDLASDRLHVTPADIFHALARLPNRPTRRQLRALMPREEWPELDRIFATHANVGGYDLRGVALFGIGECVRSEHFVELIERRAFAGIRSLMAVSHDGDRGWRFPAGSRARRYVVRTDDATLGRLADASADLGLQPGRYACSTPAIDQLVDVAGATEGVIGAQLSGAGLGGCMMVLVRERSRNNLIERLRRTLDEIGEGPDGVYLCQPVAGAGLLSI